MSAAKLNAEQAEFQEYARRFTDMPFLVTLREREDGSYAGDALLRSADLGGEEENAEWRTVVLDARDGDPAVPNGTIGDRWGERGEGSWNLDLEGIEPLLTLLGRHDEAHAEFERAASLTRNERERELLLRRASALEPG